jgi:hypothetical protein
VGEVADIVKPYPARQILDGVRCTENPIDDSFIILFLFEFYKACFQFRISSSALVKKHLNQFIDRHGLTIINFFVTYTSCFGFFNGLTSHPDAPGLLALHLHRLGIRS